MIRLARSLALAVALLYGAPTLAQSFEGLDFSTPKKKKRSSSSKKKKRSAEGDSDTSEKPAESAPADSSSGSSSSDSLDGLGLDLSGDSGKKDSLPMPPPPPGTKRKDAPVMTFDAVDVSGKTGERQRLDAAINLFKSDQYEKAAMAAKELMEDPKLAELRLEAQYVLAKSLYRMGMYHSSLGEFSKILAAGPDTRFFKTSLEWLFFISHKTVNESVILDEIAKYSNFEFPEKFRNEFRYLLARYHLVRGRALDAVEQKGEADKSFNEVKRLVLTIPRDDPFHARAKYLEAIAYFREDSYNTALESLKSVVRLTRPNPNLDAMLAKTQKELRELAFMQLARTHYGHRQNRYAIHYYSKIERGTAQWLESLFEAAWANYRIGQYEQALGNLITLSSPFFREEYFPEALILKAVIYYENCRYRESTSILEEFERTYLPVHDELEILLKKDLAASEYYTVLADVQKKGRSGQALTSTDRILERILRLALTDKDLKKTNDSILELEAELDSFGTKSDTFKYSELSKNLMEGLKTERTKLISKAGIMARSKLELEHAELKKLLANGLRIRFETTSKEKDFLEEQLRAGGRTEIVKKYKYSVAVEDDELYWPYEGEFWRDELGTYQYTLTKGCIDRDTANQQIRASN